MVCPGAGHAVESDTELRCTPTHIAWVAAGKRFASPSVAVVMGRSA